MSPLSDYTLEEIYAELKIRSDKEDIDRVKNCVINGKSSKDLTCQYGDMMGYGDNEIHYMFYLRHKNKFYDTYYGPIEKKWWPKENNENAVECFIPSGFGSSTENCYDFRGTLDEALKVLRNAGITDIRKFEGEYL